MGPGNEANVNQFLVNSVSLLKPHLDRLCEILYTGTFFQVFNFANFMNFTNLNVQYTHFSCSDCKSVDGPQYPEA